MTGYQDKNTVYCHICLFCQQLPFQSTSWHKGQLHKAIFGDKSLEYVRGFFPRKIMLCPYN